MGNQLCKYCTSPQLSFKGNNALLQEQDAFTEEEKQRRLEEETQKQSERALVYEDILRKISEEKEADITKAAVANERRRKEAEFNNKVQEDMYQLQAQEDPLIEAHNPSEERKDEVCNFATPSKVYNDVSAIASPIANSVLNVIASPITIVSPTLARTDLEMERDIEKESIRSDGDDESTPAFLFDVVFNQSSSQSVGIKILPHKLSYQTSADETNLIDCCIITSSTLTKHCQPGDIIVRINSKECIHTPLKPSVKIFDGISHMVKSIEKHLNRSKGARTVRFLRLTENSNVEDSSRATVQIQSKTSPTSLTSTEASLLLEAQEAEGIKEYIVENNRGSVSYRNSISLRDSLSLSLSLALSSKKPMETENHAPTAPKILLENVVVDASVVNNK